MFSMYKTSSTLTFVFCFIKKTLHAYRTKLTIPKRKVLLRTICNGKEQYFVTMITGSEGYI